MVVCRYYPSGKCRNGDRCKFEHPGANSNNMSNNRFAVLQGSYTDRRNNNPAGPPFPGLDKETLIKDLSTERPQWTLSAFGPGRNGPEQLFGGLLRELSFEEMRLKHYVSSNPQHTAQEAQNLVSESERQIQVALNDLDGAINFVLSAQNKHPNRNDVVAAINASGKVEDSGNPLVNTTASAPGALGAVNPFSTTSNAFGGGAFGKPSFGAPSLSGATAAFGAPSLPAPTSAFGQPSALGAATNAFSTAGSAFGQPSALGGGGAFGQPSALGQIPSPFAAATSTPFGQTPASTSAAPSGFAAFANTGSNGFSTTGNTVNPFVPNSTPAFGQHSLPSPPLNAPSGPSAMNGNPFAAAKPNNTFGQPSLPAPGASNANPFSNGNNSSRFGQPTAPTCAIQIAGGPKAFGQPSLGGFGQPSSGAGGGGANFGQPSMPSNPLTNGTSGSNGNPFSVPSSSPNPFAANTGTSNNAAPPSQMQQPPPPPPQQQQPTKAANHQSPNGPYAPNSKHTHPPLSSYTTRSNNPSQPPILTSFKNYPVRFNPTTEAYEYRLSGQVWKVVFPNGPSNFDAMTEENEEVYQDEGVRAMWEGFREKWVKGGSVQGGVGFDGGVMPEVAPKREWCLWDF